MFFRYILRNVCHFNVIFFMVLSNNKTKLPANNQKLERDPLKYCSPFYFHAASSVDSGKSSKLLVITRTNETFFM